MTEVSFYFSIGNHFRKITCRYHEMEHVLTIRGLNYAAESCWSEPISRSIRAICSGVMPPTFLGRSGFA